MTAATHKGFRHTVVAPLAPALVRAATFYGDSLWGKFIAMLAAQYMPEAHTLAGQLLRAVLFTMALVLFERWLNGDLQFFTLASSSNPPAGSPDAGVINSFDKRSDMDFYYDNSVLQ